MADQTPQLTEEQIQALAEAFDGFLAPVDRPCGRDPSGGDCDAGCDTW